MAINVKLDEKESEILDMITRNLSEHSILAVFRGNSPIMDLEFDWYETEEKRDMQLIKYNTEKLGTHRLYLVNWLRMIEFIRGKIENGS